MGEIQERITKSIEDTADQLAKRFTPHLHPRDEHGRFAVKPGSSMDVGLRRADEAARRGAVIGGPEAYFDVYRRTVLDLGENANPKLRHSFKSPPDHAPRGGTGDHGKHRPEAHQLEIKPDHTAVDHILQRLYSALRPRGAVAPTPQDEAALDEAVKEGLVMEVDLYGTKHYQLTMDGASRTILPLAA